MPSNQAWDVTVSKITYMVERASTVGWRISGNPQVGQWVLVACAEGAANYVIDGTSYSVGKGDILLLHHAMQRRAASDSKNPWHFFSVGLDLEFSSESDRRALAGMPCIVRAPQLLPLFQELSGMWEMKFPGYLLGCRGILSRILYERIRLNTVRESNPAHYACVQQVLRTMREHPDVHYDQNTLSAMTGFSPSHFRAVFKSVTGMSAGQYQNQLRINKAMDLLKEGSANVTEAAYLTGFQNIYYFSELFKKITGYAPSYFCKQRRTTERT